MKNVTINMRVRKSDLALIDKAARIAGVSRSAFIRMASERRAQLVLSNSKPALVKP